MTAMPKGKITWLTGSDQHPRTMTFRRGDSTLNLAGCNDFFDTALASLRATHDKAPADLAPPALVFAVLDVLWDFTQTPPASTPKKQKPQTAGKLAQVRFHNNDDDFATLMWVDQRGHVVLSEKVP